MTCSRCEDLEERVAWLESELGLAAELDEFYRLRQALRVKGYSSRVGRATGLVAALYAAKGRTVTKWALMETMPPKDGGEDERNPKIIDVWVCAARRGLGRDAIETVWGRGYRMTDAGLAKVRDILAPAEPVRVAA